MAEPKQSKPKQSEPKSNLAADIAKGIGEALSKNGKKPELPKGGPAPTDGDGATKQPNAIFYERDGKEYPCVVEREYQITIDRRVSENEYRKETRTVYDVRVNFRKKDIDNWAPVFGVPNDTASQRARGGALKRRIKILKES